VIGNPRLHSGSDAQGLVDPHEIVERKPASQRGPVVFPLLTEGVSEPGKAACAHPDTEVLAFDVRRTDSVGVRLTHNWDYLHGGYFGGAVAAFAFACGPVDLDELGEARAIFQRVADRVAVRCEPVRGDLKLTGGC